MRRPTAAWVRKAEDDLGSAIQLASQKPLYKDQVCFHCQQAAEKYLKALLQELAVVVPRSHDLDMLLQLLLSHDPTLHSLRRGLRTLTQYAVEFGIRRSELLGDRCARPCEQPRACARNCGYGSDWRPDLRNKERLATI